MPNPPLPLQGVWPLVLPEVLFEVWHRDWLNGKLRLQRVSKSGPPGILVVWPRIMRLVGP